MLLPAVRRGDRRHGDGLLHQVPQVVLRGGAVARPPPRQ